MPLAFRGESATSFKREALALGDRSAAFDLEPLRDNLGFFPPYQAAPVVRTEILEAHPELSEVLGPLAGRLDNKTMQKLNFEVDERKHSTAEVAHEFLLSRGLQEKEKKIYVRSCRNIRQM